MVRRWPERSRVLIAYRPRRVTRPDLTFSGHDEPGTQVKSKTEPAVGDLDRDHCKVHELFKGFSSRRPRHLDGIPGFDDEAHLASLDRAVSKRDEGEPLTATNLKDVTTDEIARLHRHTHRVSPGRARSPHLMATSFGRTTGSVAYKHLV